jgi:hypothetical protein
VKEAQPLTNQEVAILLERCARARASACVRLRVPAAAARAACPEKRPRAQQAAAQHPPPAHLPVPPCSPPPPQKNRSYQSTNAQAQPGFCPPPMVFKTQAYLERVIAGAGKNEEAAQAVRE